MCGLMKTPDALDLTVEKYHVLHGVLFLFYFVFASWVFVLFLLRGFLFRFQTDHVLPKQ